MHFQILGNSISNNDRDLTDVVSKKGIGRAPTQLSMGRQYGPAHSCSAIHIPTNEPERLCWNVAAAFEGV